MLCEVVDGDLKLGSRVLRTEDQPAPIFVKEVRTEPLGVQLLNQELGNVPPIEAIPGVVVGG